MPLPAILASLTWVKSSGGVTFHQWDMEMGEFGPSLEDISEFTSQAALAFLEGENFRNLYINAKWVVGGPGLSRVSIPRRGPMGPAGLEKTSEPVPQPRAGSPHAAKDEPS